MGKSTPGFGVTVHDWHSDPSNSRAGAVFQPAGLGVPLSHTRKRRGRRLMLLALIVVSSNAAALAVAAFVHAMRF